jgi:hypothetical protein
MWGNILTHIGMHHTLQQRISIKVLVCSLTWRNWFRLPIPTRINWWVCQWVLCGCVCVALGQLHKRKRNITSITVLIVWDTRTQILIAVLVCQLHSTINPDPKNLALFASLLAHKKAKYHQHKGKRICKERQSNMQPGKLTWRNRRLPSPTTINLEEP